jgi:RND family efflux transporter MFP subunit
MGMLLSKLKSLWNRYPKIAWPLLVVLATVLLSFILMATRPEIVPREVEVSYRPVRVKTVQPDAVFLSVRSQGTVEPRTESNLIPEVTGQVVWLSPSMVSGGYFEKGDVLLRIDDADYKTLMARSQSAVDRTQVEFETSSAEYRRTVKLHKQSLASASQLEKSQREYRVAESNFESAKIDFKQSTLDVARTIYKAPFTGRIRSEQVDMGQFISRGVVIARIYATDSVEIRLPLANKQLAFLNLPVGYRGQLTADDETDVILTGNYAGVEYEWQAKLVRTEAEIDAQSRMFYAVARVKAADWAGEQPPLMVGLFVHAEIKGRIVDDIVVLPRIAVRDNNRVLVVDQDDRLHFREVSILRILPDEVLIDGGLLAGERVCLTPLQVAVEGMKVRPLAESVELDEQDLEEEVSPKVIAPGDGNTQPPLSLELSPPVIQEQAE